MLRRAITLPWERKRERSCFYMSEHKNYHGKSFSCVVFCELSQSQHLRVCLKNPYVQKKRCLLSELAILVPSTVKMSITPLLACSLSGFGCFLITRWQVDAELCFPDPAAFSRICPGNSKSCSFVCYEELPWFLFSSW